MGLQFTSTRGKEMAVQPSETMNIQEVKEFDIVEKRQELTTQLRDSKEVDALVSTIDLQDSQSIVYFGNEVANEISKCSDVILNSVNINQINDCGKMLNALKVIMEKFDLEEISDEEKGFFSKLFANAQRQLEKILEKYHTMGDEVDKIYIQLKEYEREINEANKKLEKMFETNVDYYQQLVKYILAGEQGVREIEEHLEKLHVEYEQSPDSTLQFDISHLEQAKALLEQRVQDLRIAENVAIQSVPMIKSMQFSNMNLIRKINSAFIITLPVFKQALTQAILLRRQKIQADAMQALDEKTNEMLLKNAQNTADQTRRIAQLASGSSIKVETLEKSWQTIVKGIEDTRKIQEEAAQKREAEVVTLNRIKQEYEQLMQGKQL